MGAEHQTGGLASRQTNTHVQEKKRDAAENLPWRGLNLAPSGAASLSLPELTHFAANSEWQRSFSTEEAVNVITSSGATIDAKCCLFPILRPRGAQLKRGLFIRWCAN